MLQFIHEFFRRICWMRNSDRIGPDMPFSHWKLHFKSTMKSLCQTKFAFFGKDAEVRPGAYVIFCSRVHLGGRVIIRPGSMIFSDPNGFIKIEDDVMLGSGVHIYVSNHNFSNPKIPIIDQGFNDFSHVTLKKGCWIGANSIILPGVEIGKNAVVGAGSVVTKNIPARTVVAGNPAVIIKKIKEGS